MKSDSCRSASATIIALHKWICCSAESIQIQSSSPFQGAKGAENGLSLLIHQFGISIGFYNESLIWLIIKGGFRVFLCSHFWCLVWVEIWQKNNYFVVLILEKNHFCWQSVKRGISTLCEKTKIVVRKFSLEGCWLEINVKSWQRTQKLHKWAEMASVLGIELIGDKSTGRMERIEKMLCDYNNWQLSNSKGWGRSWDAAGISEKT